MKAKRILLIIVLTLALASSGFVAWRWMPRPKPRATAAMRQATVAMQSASASRRPPQPPAHPESQRERLLAAAFKMRGVPYVFGAKGPKTLDCSGFTKRAYAAIGVELPDGSFNQAKDEQALSSVDQLAPGDLLFYRWAGKEGVGHVTIYAGDGWVIGTGSPGQPKKVVVYPITDDLSDDGRVITFRHIRLKDEPAE